MAIKIIIGITLLLLIYILIHVIRFPYQLRMAVRNILANKNSALLTVFGILIGSSLLTSTLIVYSSISHSKESYLNQHFGVITHDAVALQQYQLKSSNFSLEDIKNINVKNGRSFLPTVSLETTLFTLDQKGNPSKFSPKAYIQAFDFEEMKIFDPIQSNNHTTALQNDEIIITEKIAKELQISMNDELYILDKDNNTHRLTVKNIVKEQGIFGYRGVKFARSTSVVSLDTSRLLTGINNNEFTNILLSSDSYGDSPFYAIPVKQKAIENLQAIDEVVKVFSITTINAILIGIVLIWSIMLLFSEERSKQTLILLKMGMSKKDSSWLFRLEGMIYVFISSILGMITGIVISYFLYKSLINVFNMGFDNFEHPSNFYVNPLYLIAGFSIFMLLTFVLIWIISRHHVKMSITGNIKTYDVQRKSIMSSLWLLILTVLMVLMLSLGLIPNIRHYLSQFISPPITFFSFFIVTILLVILSFNRIVILKRVVDFSLKSFPTFSLISRLTFGYLISKKLRNSLIILMFALVYFLLILVNVNTGPLYYEKKHSFDARKALGGYDFITTANEQIDTKEVKEWIQSSKKNDQNVENIMTVSQIFWNTFDYGTYFRDFSINGINNDFYKMTEFTLMERDKRFHTDKEAWESLSMNTDEIILSEPIRRLPGVSYEVGDSYPLTFNNQTYWKKIIGIVKEEFEHNEYSVSTGAWISEKELYQLSTDTQAIKTSILFRIADPKHFQTYDYIKQKLLLHNVYPLIRPNDDWPVVMLSFFFIFELFSGVSIVTSLIGLTVILLRVLHEKYQHFSLIRALGARRKIVFWTVFSEGAILSIIGITLGLIAGIYTGFLVVDSNLTSSEAFKYIPLIRITIYYLVGIVIALICCVIPARKALRVQPIEATRQVS